MEAPLDTVVNMIAGYAVILGVLGIYIVSLIIRFARLRREGERLKQNFED